MLLIVISGPACTGKTTLGRHIAQEFHLPFINKDGIKELLFDALGWKDRQWSQKLGRTSIGLLYHFAETLLKADQSLIIENVFRPEYATKEILDLKDRYCFEPFQIQCVADGQVTFQRFKRRSESGERHPGHGDHLNYDEFESFLLRGRSDPLDIGGRRFEVDTTDFEQIDYEVLFKAISEAIHTFCK